MIEHDLHGRRILVVEDEYLLAEELHMLLDEDGAVVLGPVGTIADAMDLINKECHLDGAVLDVSLRGEWVYPAADLLVARHIPFVFTTGYDATVIPLRFQKVPRCEKPISMRKIVQSIRTEIGHSPHIEQ